MHIKNRKFQNMSEMSKTLKKTQQTCEKELNRTSRNYIKCLWNEKPSCLENQ